MNDLSDDADTSPPLSEADINQVANSVESAPALPTSPALGSFLSRVFNPPNTSNDILRALDDMTIPPQAMEKLQPLFAEIGLNLEKDFVTDPFNHTKTRSYTAAKGKDIGVVVLLHLPGWVLQTSDAIGFLTNAIANIRDRHGRIISLNVDRPAFGYRTFLQSVSDREANNWMFVPWGDVEEALSGQTPIHKVFSISLSGPPASKQPAVAPPRYLQLEKADIDAIVEIFVAETLVDPNFFAGLVAASDWPNPLKVKANAGPRGNAEDTARFLLNLLVLWNRYDFKHPHGGDTYLGQLLLRLLDSFGSPSQTFAEIIVKYRLVNDANDLQIAKDKLPGRN